jgi:cytolysin-activating lysine-acyltransferase
MRDRIAIASAAGGDGANASSEDSSGALAGIAFWATVSDAVDAKIREQIMGGAFPFASSLRTGIRVSMSGSSM